MTKTLQSVFGALLLALPILVSAQVGINTTDPAATLDVNGNVRVRSLAVNSTMSTGGNAVQIVGLDAQGNMVPVAIGEDVVLENNEVRATSSTAAQMGTTIDITGIIPGGPNPRIDDLAVGIWPGEANEKSTLIPVVVGTGADLDITGINVGSNPVDGRIIYLYFGDRMVRLKGENTNSLAQNRIIDNGHMNVSEHGVIQLMYSTSMQRWIVLSHHN